MAFNKKSEVYLKEIEEIHQGKVYDLDTLSKVIESNYGTTVYDLRHSEARVKDPNAKQRHLFCAIALCLPIGYSPDEVAAYLKTNKSRVFAMSRLFRREFQRAIFYRYEHIHKKYATFFEKELTEKTRRNIINLFK